MREILSRPVIGGAAVAVAIMCGKFGLGGELLTVRLYATVIAMALMWPEIRALPSRRWFQFAALAALPVYFLARAIPIAATVEMVDMGYFVAQMLLIAAVATSRQARLALGITVMAAAAIYVAVATVSFFSRGQDISFGLGWGTYGSALTFYRIMLLAACVALAFLDIPGRLRYVFAAFGLFFLMVMILSIQKGALAAGVVGSIVFLVRLMERSSPRVIAAALVVILAAGSAGAWLLSDRIAYRLGNMTDPELGKGVVETDILQKDAMFRIDTRYCTFESDKLVCHEATMTDGSQRLIFLAEAFKGFIAHPVFGNGPNTYHITLIHPMRLYQDPYFYPHNIVAEIAFEGGLAGLALLLVAGLALWLAFRQTSAPEAVITASAAFAAAFFVSTVFNGDFYDSRWLWLVAVLMVYWHDDRQVA